MIAGVPIVKTNGTGNEFVLVDERVAPLADPVAFARRVCDRRARRRRRRRAADRPVGALRRADADRQRRRQRSGDVRQRDALRGALSRRDTTAAATATVETLAGPIGTRILSRAPYRVAVEMGEPRIGDAAPGRGLPRRSGRPRQPARRDPRRRRARRASTSPSSGRASSATRGIRTARTSTSSRAEGDGWRVRHWERGAGATQACGTGAVAVAAVLIAAGDATSPVTLHVPGGVLEVIWTPGGRATLDRRRGAGVRASPRVSASAGLAYSDARGRIYFDETRSPLADGGIERLPRARRADSRAAGHRGDDAARPHRRCSPAAARAARRTALGGAAAGRLHAAAAAGVPARRRRAAAAALRLHVRVRASTTSCTSPRCAPTRARIGRRAISARASSKRCSRARQAERSAQPHARAARDLLARLRLLHGAERLSGARRSGAAGLADVQCGVRRLHLRARAGCRDALAADARRVRSRRGRRWRGSRSGTSSASRTGSCRSAKAARASRCCA